MDAPARHHLQFSLILALIVALDQASKVIIRNTVNVGEREDLLPFFALSHVTNDGGAFGLFGGANSFLAVSAFVALAVIILYYLFPPRDHWLVRTGLALIAGGAIGNLLDRVYQGHVTDFLDFSHFPAFNVADAAINVGVAGVILAILFGDHLRNTKLRPDDKPE